MKLIFAIVVLLASVAENISAADLQGIQNATPAGIPLNNPSGEINGEAALEEHKLGGYRPLYPPYFERNSNEAQQRYYDKEYYSRGAQIGNFDSRLDRRLKTAAPVAPTISSDDVQVYVVSLDQQSQPQSVLQLQSQPQAQAQAQAQAQYQFQPQIHSQSQQYARGYSNYRTHQTQSYFYSFRFPNS